MNAHVFTFCHQMLASHEIYLPKLNKIVVMRAIIAAKLGLKVGHKF